MDSLGGILIKGLLGNPILAQFNLFFISVTVTETPSRGGGGTTTQTWPWRTADEEREEPVRTLTISIKFKAKEYVSTYELNEKKVRVSINILNILSRTVNVFRNISLKFKKTRD